MNIPTYCIVPDFYQRSTVYGTAFRQDSEYSLPAFLNAYVNRYTRHMRSYFYEHHLNGSILSPLNNYSRNTPIPSSSEYKTFFNTVVRRDAYEIDLWNNETPLYPNLHSMFDFFSPRTPIRKKCYYYMLLATNILSHTEYSISRGNTAWWLTKTLNMNAGHGRYRDPHVSRKKVEILVPTVSTISPTSYFEQTRDRTVIFSPKVLHIPFIAYTDACSYVNDGNWRSFWHIIAFLYQNRTCFPETETTNIYVEDSDQDYFYGPILEHYLHAEQRNEDITVPQLVRMINKNEYSMETLDKIYAILSEEADK